MFLINNQYFKLAKDKKDFYARFDDVFNKDQNKIVKLTTGDLVRLMRLFYILKSSLTLSAETCNALLSEYSKISSLKYLKNDSSYFVFSVDNEEVNFNFESIEGAYIALEKVLDIYGILNHVEEEVEKWQIKVIPDNVKIYKNSVNDITTDQEKNVLKEFKNNLKDVSHSFFETGDLQWTYPLNKTKMTNMQIQKFKDVYRIRYNNSYKLLQEAIVDKNKIDDYYISLKLLSEAYLQLTETIDSTDNILISGEKKFKHKVKKTANALVDSAKKKPLEESLSIFEINIATDVNNNKEDAVDKFITKTELDIQIAKLKNEIIHDISNNTIGDKNKELTLYDEQGVTIIYSNNMYKFSCGALQLNLYLDNIINFSTALSKCINNELSTSLKIEDGIIVFNRLNNNDINIKHTDSKLNETNITLESYAALTLPFIIDRLTHLSAIYSTLSKNRYLYVEEAQVEKMQGIETVKIDTDNVVYIESEEEIENVDDNKMPINLWTPYVEGHDLNLLQPSAAIEDFVSFTSLLLVINPDKINNDTVNITKKYVDNIITLNKDITVQTLVLAHEVLKKFMSDPRPLQNNITLRRTIRRFRNFPIVQTLMYMSKNNVEDIDKFVLISCAYLISVILENDLEV